MNKNTTKALEKIILNTYYPVHCSDMFYFYDEALMKKTTNEGRKRLREIARKLKMVKQ